MKKSRVVAEIPLKKFEVFRETVSQKNLVVIIHKIFEESNEKQTKSSLGICVALIQFYGIFFDKFLEDFVSSKLFRFFFNSVKYCNLLYTQDILKAIDIIVE